MLLESSPPAQAARTIGSSSVAAHLANLAVSLTKGHSPLSIGAENRRSFTKLEITENGTGPPPLGKQWCTGRAVSRRARRGNVDRTAPFGKPHQCLWWR